MYYAKKWIKILPSAGNKVERGSGCIDTRVLNFSRLPLKCDGTRAETRFRLSTKRRSPFKSAGASVQSTTGSRVVRISGSIAGYTMFRGSVKSTGYPLHSPVSPSLPLPCVTVCHHISTGIFNTSFDLENNVATPTARNFTRPPPRSAVLQCKTIDFRWHHTFAI
jgi:hypothetical protein